LRRPVDNTIIADMTAIQIPCARTDGRVTALVLHSQPETYIERLKTGFPHARFVLVNSYAGLDAALERERPDAILCFKIAGQGAFPRERIFAAPSVRWVHAAGAGIDHLAPWDASRVMVTNSSGLHGRSLAMLVTWAILNRALGMPAYAAAQRERQWRPHPLHDPGNRLVAIVGFGRIGAVVARHLRPFGFHIVGVRRTPSPSPDADEVVGLDALVPTLERADHVVLILPSTPDTRDLFDAEMLATCKPGAHLINIARGGIVDEAALRAALAAGRIGSATLDVFATEPLPPTDPLWDTPNVVITPHSVADTAGWQARVAEIFADNLHRWLEARPLRNLCDPALGY
jgi:phosphoglycerate dehydrogenase-like enzyme